MGLCFQNQKRLMPVIQEQALAFSRGQARYSALLPTNEQAYLLAVEGNYLNEYQLWMLGFSKH
jgi:hypothetical protein